MPKWKSRLWLLLFFVVFFFCGSNRSSLKILCLFTSRDEHIKFDWTCNAFFFLLVFNRWQRYRQNMSHLDLLRKSIRFPYRISTTCVSVQMEQNRILEKQGGIIYWVIFTYCCLSIEFSVRESENLFICLWVTMHVWQRVSQSGVHRVTGWFIDDLMAKCFDIMCKRVHSNKS